MEDHVERRANEYRAYLRAVYGEDIPVYTAVEVSLEDGMVRMDLMGTDGVAVKHLTMDEALRLAEMLRLWLYGRSP